jgi:hypothetical protein
MATGAQADELSALKAQLEALQSRVSQLVSLPAAAPALPPGTKLLTVRKGQGTYSLANPMPAADRLHEHQGYTIAVTPTADMPAPVSEVTVSGEIRVLALYSSVDVDGSIDLNANDTTDVDESDVEFDDFDIATRGQLRVDGRTETAIGEVGGTIRLRGTRGGGNAGASGLDDSGGGVNVNIAWGYWQMTPNWQLGAGYAGSTATIQAGWDYSGIPDLVGLDAGPTNIDTSQFRLTYNNGGLTLAVALEDNNQRSTEEGDDHLGSDDWFFDEAVFPAVAGFITFDTGSFLVTAAAIWEADDTDTTIAGYEFEDTEDNWMVGVGAILRLSDMFRLEGAAQIGEGYCGATYVDCVVAGTSGEDVENDMEYWGASVLAVISFHEAMRVELGAAYSDVDHESDELGGDVDDTVETAWSVGATLFWDPVDQLTLGAGVGFTNKESDDGDGEYDSVNAGFGAWFRF